MRGEPREIDARRWFWGALAVTLALRFWLSAALPLTGDEAYFVEWGRWPDIGYYDHPPMVGWLLALMLEFSNSVWVLRLPAVLLPAVLALMARAALPAWFGVERRVADLTAAVLLLVPMNVWNVLVTTDTPLVAFSFAAMLLFSRAASQSRSRDAVPLFFLSGIFLGLAFLSKYFAVLLGLGMLVWSVSVRGRRPGWLGLSTVVLAALPAGLLNLWWNYQSCWSNVMFNAINRHEGAGLNALTPALYVASLAYLAAPMLWYVLRERRALADSAAEPGARAMLLAWLVPLAVFAALSPAKKIGLHWLLSFLPALAVSLAIILPAVRMLRIVRFFAVLAALHAAAIAVIAVLPLDTWQSSRLYSRLVFLFRAPELAAQMARLQGYEPASDNYSAGSVLSYHLGRHVFVFGIGSSHARHDDILTDMRRYEGRDIAVLRREAPPMADYAPYFRTLEVRELTVAGAQFHLVLGRGFRYEAYREGVLKVVRERWYRIPGALPIGSCYYCDRYFSTGPCGR
jgi:4-amino-4-deoxy-L-arabinose transferase-like glycosyltransferase